MSRASVAGAPAGAGEVRDAAGVPGQDRRAEEAGVPGRRQAEGTAPALERDEKTTNLKNQKAEFH